MDDPITLVLLIRGGIAAFLALIGGWCVYLGYRLLFSKGTDKSESSFEATIVGHKVSFSAGAAGTAIVFISAVWVIGAVIAVPTLNHSPEGTIVAFGPDVTHSTGVERVAAVEFEANRVALTPDQKQFLDSFLAQVKASGTTPKIVIEGYAEVGQPEVNATIAERRAQTVRAYIVQKHGIDPRQIQTLSYGESPPVAETNRNAVVLTATRKQEGG